MVWPVIRTVLIFGAMIVTAKLSNWIGSERAMWMFVGLSVLLVGSIWLGVTQFKAQLITRYVVKELRNKRVL